MENKLQLQSIYAYHLEEFIRMKRKLGFKYKTGTVMLSQIDRLAYKREEASIGITKEFADIWGEKQPNITEEYRYKKIRLLKVFSTYLRDKGIQSYVPRLPPYPNNTFIPHIYSDKEIIDLFQSVDELRLDRPNKTSYLFSMPALLRLLYATGLRISEALALKDKDVNLDEYHLRIRDSKNGKERIIPISASLVEVCKTYRQYRDHLPLKSNKTNTFFIKINGQPLIAKRTDYWFKKCLQKAAIPHGGGKQGPRLHDLRHTFAVNSMASMAQAGLDLYVSLPILSNYLGHQSIRATERYVRLTASRYPDLIKDVNMLCLDVFPKFK